MILGLLLIVVVFGMVMASYLAGVAYTMREIRDSLRKLHDEIRELKKSPAPKPWESAKPVKDATKF